MICGLLGEKLGHSYSPRIHGLLGDYTYTLFEKKPEELEEFLKNGDFSGINVTIPYKKAVIPYCKKLTPTAQRLGAVNTLVLDVAGDLIGHNTDYSGFTSMLEKSGLSVAGKKVLVLGSGGASVTAQAVLQEKGAQVVVISRQGPDNYENLQKHQDARVIVNATPVGMYPNTGVAPVDVALFPQLEGVLDLIYNPARTQLLMDAEAKGCITENGLWMLVAQAVESAQWFMLKEISKDTIEKIYHQIRRPMENLILIGMPGCGKSTVGQLLAQKTGRTFVDADEAIREAAGMTIPEIFAQEGEDGFRKRETQVLGELGKASGLVIATGGGCVTREENYPLLHQNGTIYFLQREISHLPTEGRPLSQAGNLEEMFNHRKPLYEAFADKIVDNNKTLEDTLSQILTQEDMA